MHAPKTCWIHYDLRLKFTAILLDFDVHAVKYRQHGPACPFYRMRAGRMSLSETSFAACNPWRQVVTLKIHMYPCIIVCSGRCTTYMSSLPSAVSRDIPSHVSTDRRLPAESSESLDLTARTNPVVERDLFLSNAIIGGRQMITRKL